MNINKSKKNLPTFFKRVPGPGGCRQSPPAEGTRTNYRMFSSYLLLLGYFWHNHNLRGTSPLQQGSAGDVSHRNVRQSHGLLSLRCHGYLARALTLTANSIHFLFPHRPTNPVGIVCKHATLFCDAWVRCGGGNENTYLYGVHLYTVW